MDFESTFVESGLIYAIEYALAIFITCGMAAALWRRRRLSIDGIQIQEPDSHIWTVVDEFTFPTYCNECERQMTQGVSCDACGICAHDACMAGVTTRLPCKTSVTGMYHQQSLHHFWVKGNLPTDSMCVRCGEICDNYEELTGYHCAWCQRTLHSECMDGSSVARTPTRPVRPFDPDAPCDLGPFADFIVSPATVALKKVGWKGRKHLVVDEVVPPGGGGKKQTSRVGGVKAASTSPPRVESLPHLRTPSWSPLVVIGTKKSGNNDGAAVLAAFRRVLNTAQVIDLDIQKPEHGLEWCHLMPEGRTCRVLVCGGDGTIGWVLDTVDRLGLRPRPPVGLLPLGTGNDLARVLHWGAGHSGAVDTKKILYQLSQAEVEPLDRWAVRVEYNRHLGFRWPSRRLNMNNYASLGVDALVTLNFHRQRTQQPHIFRHRLLNKLVYFFYGTKDVLERECQDLSSRLTLELDGKRVELPALEGVVVLNIPSWGAGCRVWEVGSSAGTPAQEYNDGKLEVIGLYSSFHIAQLQVGLSEPVRLGQASREVRITVSDRSVPMQVDGEPWEQQPATITITPHLQQPMLVNTVGDDLECW